MTLERTHTSVKLFPRQLLCLRIVNELRPVCIRVYWVVPLSQEAEFDDLFYVCLCAYRPLLSLQFTQDQQPDVLVAMSRDAAERRILQHFIFSETWSCMITNRTLFAVKVSLELRPPFLPASTVHSLLSAHVESYRNGTRFFQKRTWNTALPWKM